MKYPWFIEYCLSKKGAEKDFNVEWEATRYFVGGKIFALQGKDKAKKEIINLKCEPAFGQVLRSQYPDIVPGYHMNKEHWNSVYSEGHVPDDILKQMIDMSYSLVLGSLSKKRQKEILGESLLS